MSVLSNNKCSNFCRRLLVGLLIAAFISPLVHTHADGHHPILSGRHETHHLSSRHKNIHADNLLEADAVAAMGCNSFAASGSFYYHPDSDAAHAHFKVDFLPRFRTDRLDVYPVKNHFAASPEILTKTGLRIRSADKQLDFKVIRPEIILYSSDLSPPVV